MNNKEFITELAQRSGYTQELTQRLVHTFVESMGDSFCDGEAVLLTGFGTFEVKKRMERTVMNPSTGLKMLVPPKLVLGFKPVASIKEKLKNGGRDDD
ncbi:MAG: HU family DNA-binding protein [Prevotella sp.]|nr:HU family DNA-binding protein [Prevotella sp.]